MVWVPPRRLVPSGLAQSCRFRSTHLAPNATSFVAERREPSGFAVRTFTHRAACAAPLTLQSQAMVKVDGIGLAPVATSCRPCGTKTRATKEKFVYIESGRVRKSEISNLKSKIPSLFPLPTTCIDACCRCSTRCWACRVFCFAASGSWADHGAGDRYCLTLRRYLPGGRPVARRNMTLMYSSCSKPVRRAIL